MYDYKNVLHLLQKVIFDFNCCMTVYIHAYTADDVNSYFNKIFCSPVTGDRKVFAQRVRSVLIY